jgi:hypothetical protein
VAEQQRIEKPAPQTREQDAAQLAEEDAAVAAAQVKAQPDLSDLDDLLDEIDTILEEQEVLTSYRQRGGQ